MTSTEEKLRECVIAAQCEVSTMGPDRHADPEFGDGMFLLKTLLQAVSNRNKHLPFEMTFDAATKRNAYDFARWMRHQE